LLALKNALIDKAEPINWRIRQILTTADSFEEAIQFITTNINFITDAYITISGTQKNEGVVLTFDANRVADY